MTTRSSRGRPWGKFEALLKDVAEDEMAETELYKIWRVVQDFV